MATLRVGSVFGGEWRVLGRIAEGGMGTVYRVEQRSTGQLRALKVLRAGLWEDPRARERFEQEALLVAKIRSEHITKVIAAGIDEDEGAPWIAMELLEGETLKKRVERDGPYGRREALELARQLCHALATAHEAGIVHRDLKPENIFVTQSDRAGGGELVKLLDFGIATALEEFETSATVTSVIGSPLWMAPEQVRRERIRPATDVWALGLLMFWALTGRAYWKKTFPADAVLFEKMVEPLVSASARAKELERDGAIPPGFDPWFARCVSRKIDERYRDASEAFDAFERVMTDPRMPRALPASRRRLLTTVALTALGAAASAWIARPYLAPPASAPRDDAPIQMVLSIQDSGVVATIERDASAIDARETGASDAADGSDDAAATHGGDAREPRDASAPREPRDAGRGRIDGGADAPRALRPGDAREPAVVLAPNAPGAAPTVTGFTVRRFAAAQSLCTARGASRPWQVIPDWFLQRRSELRIDERTRRLAAERNVRLTDESAMRTAAESLANQEQSLERDRAMIEAEVQRSLGALRSTLAARAREAHCAEAGLRADGAALYATWCCR